MLKFSRRPPGMVGRCSVTTSITMRTAAAERVRQGQPMPGLFLVVQTDENWAEIIDDIQLIAVCSEPGEWEGRERFVRYVDF